MVPRVLWYCVFTYYSTNFCCHFLNLITTIPWDPDIQGGVEIKEWIEVVINWITSGSNFCWWRKLWVSRKKLTALVVIGTGWVGRSIQLKPRQTPEVWYYEDIHFDQLVLVLLPLNTVKPSYVEIEGTNDFSQIIGVFKFFRINRIKTYKWTKFLLWATKYSNLRY